MGQLLSSQGEVSILRVPDEMRLAAHQGDLLLAGEILVTGNGSADFVYCPTGAAPKQQTLQPHGRLEFRPDSMVTRAGTLASAATPAYCELPEIEAKPEGNAKGAVDLDVPPSGDAVRDRLSEQDRAELDRIDSTLKTNPNDPVARTSRAVLFERNGLRTAAAGEFALIARSREDLAWAKALVHENLQPSAAVISQSPATYAVVIGISRYGRPSEIPDLQFADRDAQEFYEYLRSARGGSLPQANIRLLRNEDATKDAIRNSINQFLAKPRSRLIVFISAHGAVSNGEGYLLTYRSDPSQLQDSAYPMKALTDLIYAGPVGRIDLFVDACRSGHIGRITEKNQINRYLLYGAANVFGMMASREGEVAWEYKGFGEGHGAFTYFLLRALNTPDAYGAGKLTIYDLTRYVEDKVRFATGKRQTPQDETRSIDINEDLALLKNPGIPVGRWDGKPMPESVFPKQKGLPLFDIDQPPPAPPSGISEADLETLIALENQGQAILLRYLKGDEIAQDKSEFERGITLYAQALRLAPNSVYLESRKRFFEGRTAIFDKDWTRARADLELAIRLNPSSPAPYNALGISYLEQARYDDSIAAFDDAIRRAPYWPYPRHNLALAYSQQGQYTQAVAAYRKAMEQAPSCSYLPYNLGLLFAKINRPREAEESYLRARALARERAGQADAEARARPGDTLYQLEAERLEGQRIPPATALGVLKAGDGRHEEARRYYDEALALLSQHPDMSKLLVVRHDLGLLAESEKGGTNEAINLWKRNIAEGNYLPSRISLARALLATKSDSYRQAAIEQYEAVIQADPDNAGIRLQLADQLEAVGRVQDALNRVLEAARLAPASIAVQERAGDLQARLGHKPEALAAYQLALSMAVDSRTRRRIESAIARLE